MDTQNRLLQLELKLEKIEKFLPDVELWLRVLAEQFKLNRSFILALDKKPEEPKAEVPNDSKGTEVPTETPQASNP